jgi:hypothetical protein
MNPTNPTNPINRKTPFFIDHHHIFSAVSLALLAARAGFNVQVIERLHEPSTKYTLRGFLIP